MKECNCARGVTIYVVDHRNALIIVNNFLSSWLAPFLAQPLSFVMPSLSLCYLCSLLDVILPLSTSFSPSYSSLFCKTILYQALRKSAIPFTVSGEHLYSPLEVVIFVQTTNTVLVCALHTYGSKWKNLVIVFTFGFYLFLSRLFSMPFISLIFDQPTFRVYA